MRLLLDPKDLPEDMKLAVSYLRVSSSSQVDTDYSAEGLSLPAQRKANHQAAERLGAVIVAEFMDCAESAKSADRPELQDMLRFIKDAGNVSYVIVNKVDRLARSREDDVIINLAIRKAGAQLVSAAENIDATPPGKLMHGIMAAIAEFYSANLAEEARKGMRQKASVGGTPGLAPLGYNNVRENVDGREIRTVAVDPERAPLIQWMFEAYASGDWTMSMLAGELERRGLRIPATRKRPRRPVSIQHIDKMLGNRYYIGFVTFEGIEYQGRHPALIEQYTFDQVQAVRKVRRETREKTQSHPQYLKGHVFCGQCGGRLGVTNARNRWGTIYPYFYCINRARLKNCQQRAVLIADVEAAVADWWRCVEIDLDRIAEIRSLVSAQLDHQQERDQAELTRQHARVAELRRQQMKLIEARYADAIPLELLKSEQERISHELTGAQQIIDRCSQQADAIMRAVDEVLLLCADAHQLYLSAPPQIRQQLNQAVFKRFWVVDDTVTGTELAEPFGAFLEPEGSAASLRRADAAVRESRSTAQAATETKNPILAEQEPGSNICTRVALKGPILNPSLARYICAHLGLTQ